MRTSRAGFTVIELLIFAAIFSVITLSFITILVGVTRVQVRQGSSAEVNQQSQFLLETVQRYVESSSLVEMTANAPVNTLRLRMAASAVDPTLIYSNASGTVYIQQGATAAEALTTDDVTVTEMSFVKRSHPGGKDSVAVSFTMSYNTTNPQRIFVQGINSSIARVSAATFDSNVIPGADNTYKLGASSQLWQSLNDIIYFSGSNVGIGVSTPGQTLEVNGGLRLNTNTAKPTCASGQRGTFWVTQNGGGTKDNVEVCARDASSTYAWRTIY